MPKILTWFDNAAVTPPAPELHENWFKKLKAVTEVIEQRGTVAQIETMRQIAVQQLQHLPAGASGDSARAFWLPLVMRLDPTTATPVLEALLSGVPVTKTGPGARWIADLFGKEIWQDRKILSRPVFTPQVLLPLIRLAHHHVRVEDDNARKCGPYRPDERDHAERGRDALYGALMDQSGPDAWAAKQELASDPLFAEVHDRTRALAHQTAAQEQNLKPMHEEEVVAFERDHEACARSRDDMFRLMCDRLDGIDDLLRDDGSPRELWALINEEKLLRRAIARELRLKNNGLYSINQEAVTGDEKEMDIRLTSKHSDQEAVIELKLGNNSYSGADLQEALRDQLVGKYLAPDTRKAGCLLIAVRQNRRFAHPRTGALMDLDEMQSFLRTEAREIEQGLQHTVQLTVRLLDLRPRG